MSITLNDIIFPSMVDNVFELPVIHELFTSDIEEISYSEKSSSKADVVYRNTGEKRNHYLRFSISAPLKSLEKFPTSIGNLKIISLNAPSLSSFAPIAHLAAQIEILHIKNVSTLQGLACEFPCLKKLTITSDSLTSFAGFPTSLPTLEHIRLHLRAPQLDAIFTHFPHSFPALKTIYIEAPALTTLAGFPNDLPRLSELTLRGELPHPKIGITPAFRTNIASLRDLPASLPALTKLTILSHTLPSCHGFPSHLPLLQDLLIGCPLLPSLDGFPSSLPSLRKLKFHACNLRSLHGFPKKGPKLEEIWLTHSNLSRIDTDLHQFPRLSYLSVDGNPLRSLHNIPYRLLTKSGLFDQLLHLREGSFPPTRRVFPKHPFRFSAQGLEMVLLWLNSPVEGPLTVLREGGQRALDMLAQRGIDLAQVVSTFSKERFALKPACQALAAFYAKSPMALATQYVHSRAYALHDGDMSPPLSEEEYGRLLHEVEVAELTYLQAHLPDDDKVLRQFRENTL